MKLLLIFLQVFCVCQSVNFMNHLFGNGEFQDGKKSNFLSSSTDDLITLYEAEKSVVEYLRNDENLLKNLHVQEYLDKAEIE